MSFGPPFARFVIDRLPTKLYSVIIGEVFCLTGIIIGTYTGTHTIAGPIIQAFLLDLGIQTTQIANRTAIYAIEPKARNRVNTAFMFSVFVGQLVGTAVGNRLYALGDERSENGSGGGWIASGSCSVGFIVVALGLCMVRGPREERWVGWNGGWPRLKRVTESGNGRDIGDDAGETGDGSNEVERKKGPQERGTSGVEKGVKMQTERNNDDMRDIGDSGNAPLKDKQDAKL